MSTTALKIGRAIAILAFMAVGTWLAFWHHSDGMKPIFLLALALPFAANAWLAYLIRSRELGQK
jgi:hypothetical protein